MTTRLSCRGLASLNTPRSRTSRALTGITPQQPCKLSSSLTSGKTPRAPGAATQLAHGKLSPVTSRVSAGDAWNGPETWESGEYFQQNDLDTWGNTYAWQVFPQLEQVLAFSRTMLVLSENGHLSDTDAILGDTHATLGHFETERFERSHQTTSTAHNPSGFWYHLRERFATLAYDDLFELSRTRLSEHIPLFNEQAITREHGSTGSLEFFQASGWTDSSPTWDTASDWQTGGYYDAAAEPTWREAYSWTEYPQLERVLNFNTSGVYLSETTDGLSETHHVLGWPTSERFERDYFAQATENRQSFTTRQHVRTYRPATVALYVESTWGDGYWAGDVMDAWTVATSVWTGDATDEWSSTAWGSDAWAAGSLSIWDTENWLANDPTTWDTHQMWVKIARWQVASEVVEAVHQTHT